MGLAEDQQTELSRPKKRKKVAAAATSTADTANTAAAADTAAATAAADTAAATAAAATDGNCKKAVPCSGTQGPGGDTPPQTAAAGGTKKSSKKKRKRSQTEAAETDAVAKPDQHAGPASEGAGDASKEASKVAGDASKGAGDASEGAVDASGAAGDASKVAGDASTPTEEKKQSRSARRKQLKRRFRRLGVAPPAGPVSHPQPSPSASVNPALAAAAEASPFDPNGAQPHQGTLPSHAVSDSPPAKRLRTQAGSVAQTVKAQLRARSANDAPGHVHFADSDTNLTSESDDESESLPAAPKPADDRPSTSKQLSADPQGSSQIHIQSHNKTDSAVHMNGVHTESQTQVRSADVLYSLL